MLVKQLFVESPMYQSIQPTPRKTEFFPNDILNLIFQ